ncbi:MAG: glycosyltransferase [Egibacteraceae bacterium]
MSRFLFVVPPLAGHVNPTVGVAAALAGRGHQVAWAGVAELVRPLVGAQATVFGCAGPLLGDGGVGRPAGLRGPAALRFLWEGFLCPLAEAMVPGVQTAVERFGPDVVVADQQAVAGALVAERAGLVWATSATTSAELAGPLAGTPKVQAWLDGLLAGLRRRFGDPDAGGDLRFSPYLVVAFTTEALTGPSAGRVGGRVRFVGPSLAPRPGADGFPWGWLDAGGPVALVSLGTVSAEVAGRFLGQCARAAHAGSGWRAVVVDPGGALGVVGGRVLVRRAVPQLRLLARVDAVVCHGGHNTVCEALAHGLPLVVAPIRDDQPIVAGQVVDAGTGVRLRFSRATAAQIGAAVQAVLTEPRYRQAAQRVQQSFAAAGGAHAAADHLEALAARSAHPPLAAEGAPR